MAKVVEEAVAERVSAAGLAGRLMGALSGAAFVVLILVGNTLYEEGGFEALGLAVELLGFAAVTCFIAYAATALRTRGWAAHLFLVGGVSMVAIKVGSLAPVLAAGQEDITPDAAAALIEINNGAFVVSWFPHGLFVLGLAAAALVAGRLPRIVAWVGMGLGAACAAMVAVPVDEPFVAPYLLSLLWIVAASVLLTRGELRRGRAWTVDV